MRILIARSQQRVLIYFDSRKVKDKKHKMEHAQISEEIGNNRGNTQYIVNLCDSECVNNQHQQPLTTLFISMFNNT